MPLPFTPSLYIPYISISLLSFPSSLYLYSTFLLFKPGFAYLLAFRREMNV